MSLVAGQILDGKYRIVRVLGTGGMGAVYEGENTRIHRKVAIKVLHASVAGKQDIVQRFEREAQAAGRIGSQHIVEVLDLGNLDSGERYMVMEFLDGEPLTKRIKVRGRIPPHELAPLLLQLLDGLGGAHHAGIIHRDLKPDNVYVVRRQGQDFVKLLDFGVSKFTSMGEELSMTKTGAVMGTPYYMSPEQARGQTVDLRSDLYSVGVVAYQCLAGRVPFNAETFNELIFKIALEAPEPLEAVAPGVDPGFSAIVRKAMEREVAQRFQTAGDFARAIYDWQQGAAGQHHAAPMQQAAMHHSGGQQQGYSPQMARSNPQLSQSGAGGYGGANLAQSSPNAFGGSNPGLSNTGPNGALYASQAGGSRPGVTPAPTVLGDVPAANASGKSSKGGLIAAALGLVVVLGGGGVFAFLKMKGTSPAPATAATVEATTAPSTTGLATTSTATSTVSTAATATATESAPPVASESAPPAASSEATASASVASATAPKIGVGKLPPPPVKTTSKPDNPPPPKPTGGRPIDPSL